MENREKMEKLALAVKMETRPERETIEERERKD